MFCWFLSDRREDGGAKGRIRQKQELLQREATGRSLLGKWRIESKPTKHGQSPSEFPRYHNPNAGRWLSRDPIAERGGLNLYGMVGNNLVGQLDRLGLTKVTVNEHFPSSVPTATWAFNSDLNTLGWTHSNFELKCKGGCNLIVCEFTVDPKTYKNANVYTLTPEQWNGVAGHEYLHASHLLYYGRYLAKTLADEDIGNPEKTEKRASKLQDKYRNKYWSFEEKEEAHANYPDPTPTGFYPKKGA